MKTFTLLALSAALLACNKNDVQLPEETAVNKTVSFEVYAKADYSASVFYNAQAQVHLSITRINFKTNTMQVYWDTLYTMRQLKLYPQVNDKIVLQKIVPHLENSEVLQVSKEIRYRSDGAVRMEALGEPVLKNENQKLMTVAL